MRRLVPAVCAAGALALAHAATATAANITESASAGVVTAQLGYEKARSSYSGATVTIFRNGSIVLEETLPEPCEACSAGPAYKGRRSSVQILQLDSSPEPEVVVDLFSGGADCCFYSRIYNHAPSISTYVGLTQHWLDVGYRLIDPERDGLPEFRSADARFAFEFGAFGAGSFPPRVWRFSGGRMIDVTTSYPVTVRGHARRQLRAYRRLKGRANVRPVLAAIAADRCLLGRCAGGLRFAKLASRRGYLMPDAEFFAPTGKQFLSQLRRFLRQTGYR